jgi:hypothetical protein
MVEKGRSRRFKEAGFLSSSQKKVGISLNNGKPNKGTSRQPLHLEPGDIVEIKTENEILATLDSSGKYEGLRFTSEMKKYCGKKFKVYRKLKKIIIETTGELRTVNPDVPIVLLERVYCDGSAHGGCDRSCLCYWREEWLKRVSL